MTAILKRELRAYFQTVIAWIFIAVLLAVFGLYFYVYNLSNGYPYVIYSMNSICFILTIMVPVLTMRSFAEERRNKTDQMILTAPVKGWQIVVGKYLAMISVYTMVILLIAFATAFLSLYGPVPMGENFLAIFGFWLYGCAMIATGMFISSLTENIVIAAVLSFALLLTSYMMESICGLISRQGNAITRFLGIFDLSACYQQFQGGCLKLSAVTYYLSVIFLMGFFTLQSLLKRRWSVDFKKLSIGIFQSATVLVVIALTIVCNLVVSVLPEKVTVFDCSPGQIYQLTDTTEAFVGNLQEDVRIYMLARESEADSQIKESLNRYKNLNGHIQVIYVDTAADPSFYKNYTEVTPSAGSLIVESEKRSRVIDYSEIYLQTYTIDESTSSYIAKTSGYDAEGQLTSAIEYVTMNSDEMPLIYTITGHDEEALGEHFKNVLAKANITTGDLELMKLDRIPEKTAAVIINAPKKDFNQADAQKVIDYMKQGGNVILTEDYGHTDLPNFHRILDQFGLIAGPGMVVENDSQHYYNGNPSLLLPEVNNTPYTKSVYEAYIFAPYCMGISYQANEYTASAKIEVKTLLETTAYAAELKSLAPMDLTAQEQFVGDQGTEGIHALAVAASDQDCGAQLVLIGTSFFLKDETDSVVSSNNSRMFAECVGQMTGEVSAISGQIPVKNISMDKLTVPTMTAIIGGAIMIGGVPLVLLVIGIGIWVIRRKE